MMQEEEEEEEKGRKTTTVSVNVLDEGGDDDEEFVRQMQKKRLEQLKNGTFEATTLVVVRWCFGGRNHRTCDDGLFYFSDGRKRERDAEENDVFVHSLARASFFVFFVFFFFFVVFLS